MYEIEIPEDVQILDPRTEKPVEGAWLKFVEIARVNWLTDHRFTANDEKLEQAQDIREKLHGKNPGDKIELHNNDYSLLLEVVKCPEHRGPNGIDKGYSQNGHLVLPFINAVKGAKKIEKTKAKKKPEPVANDDDDEDDDP